MLSPSPGKRHDKPVTATEWPSRLFWADITRCIGMIYHESVENFRDKSIGAGHTEQGLTSSCGGLEVSIQSEEDAAQKKRRLHEYVGRGPKF